MLKELKHKIHIAKDFSDAVGGRFIKDGPYSGELFRKIFLETLFTDPNDKGIIEIKFDGTYDGYAICFLEEAFGGLARIHKNIDVKDRFVFISEEDPLLVNQIMELIDEANGKRCKGVVETFSRVTGFYRPVQIYNDGKKQEYKDRRTYKLKDEDKCKN